MPRYGPPDGGSEYPLVNPSEDIVGKITDFHLAYDGNDAIPPLRIQRMEGVGRGYNEESSASRESSGDYFYRPEIVVVDAGNNVIVDTTSLSVHTTRAWGNYLIHSWSGDGIYCYLAATPASESGLPENIEPDSAILDERTWRQPVRRVRKLIVDGQELRGKVSIYGGFNTEVTQTTGDLSEAINLLGNRNSPFEVESFFISAEPGSGLGRYPDCEDEDPPIRRINNITPDQSGNFTFMGRGCTNITRPVTYSSGAAVPDPSTVVVSDNCEPCCDCHDFEKVAIGMRRLWDQFRSIGQRAEVVRDQYREIRDRMLAARDCIRAAPIRITMTASKGTYVDLLVAFCSTDKDCKYNVRLEIDFQHIRNQLGYFDNDSYFATDSATGRLVEYSSLPNGANYPYPWFNHVWPYVRPNQLNRVRIRLSYDNYQSIDELTVTARHTIAGTYPTEPATATVTIRR